jgi:hypothetical protein
MKLANVYTYRLEYEVPPDLSAWTAIVAALTHEDAIDYVQRYWGKKCNFTSVGQHSKLDAISLRVLSQIMKLGSPGTKVPDKKPVKKEEIKK